MKSFFIMFVALLGQTPLFAQKNDLISLKTSSKVTINIVSGNQSTVDAAKAIASAPKNNVVSRDNNNKVVSYLENITISDDQLFYKLRIKNRSHISYDVDFIRFYVRDLKSAKRTVTQELEMKPTLSYGSAEASVRRKSSQTYVFAFEKFPLSADKAFVIEVYERNGGRHQYLKVKAADIFKARALK